MKRFLFAMFSVYLLFALLSFGTVSVDAATEGDYEYSISNGEATLKKFLNKEQTDVVIPSSLGGCPVTKIGDSAFSQKWDLTSVVIPNTVKEIGNVAFERCYGLKSVTIPPSLQKTGKQVFKDCDEISEVHITDLASWCNVDWGGTSNVAGRGPLYEGAKLYLNNQLITKLIIPEGVSKIEMEAFWGCESITSVVIPSTVKMIYSSAFSGCTEISDVWYVGSESERNDITISSGNTYLTDAVWHYDSCPIGAPHSYDNDCDSTCNGCDKIRSVSGHSYDNACDPTCNICKETRTVTHKYGEWETTKHPSCTESGTKVRKCSVCFKVETVTLSPLDHDFSDEWTVDEAATCTSAGSKSNHCTRCSATKNNTTILANGHSWGEWITEKEATQETEGLAARKCSECGLKETQTISKLAADGHTHKFGEWQIIKAATCKEKGNATRTCSVCKEQERKELLSTGHQVGDWVETSATCTNDGVRERTCVICNETEKIIIKALGHDFEEAVVVKEPTSSESGVMQSKCKRCDEERIEMIPALSGDTAVDDNKEATPKPEDDFHYCWVVIVAISLMAIGGLVWFLLARRASKTKNQKNK
ncbi:MAG: leucine-rich repeat domain-containing protein [Ruminococcaceae bacterium]|nr:leucine-rich repeat domain-containing protein [Oscillospiraceae bacterium]